MEMPLFLWLTLVCFPVISCSARAFLGHAISPMPAAPPKYGIRRHGTRHVPHPNIKFPSSVQTITHSPTSSRVPFRSNIARPPTVAPPWSRLYFRNHRNKFVPLSTSSPSNLLHKHHSKYHRFSHAYSKEDPSLAPSPSSSTSSKRREGPAPSPTDRKTVHKLPSLPPTISPLSSSSKANSQPPSPMLTLPPPPPNADCASVTCLDPFTYKAVGSPCGCVRPIQVKLRLSVALYTFFPLVSKLAEDVASSTVLYENQVRIMAADAESQQLEKTIVLIDLIPLGNEFDKVVAFSIYRLFWHKEIFIDTSLFGAYEVLYVHYPGLPPSPPSEPYNVSSIDDGPSSGSGNSGSAIKPIGVDLSQGRNDSISRRKLSIIALSSGMALAICIGIACAILLKYRWRSHGTEETRHAQKDSSGKPSGAVIAGSRTSSVTISYTSNSLAYIGTAKVFKLNDIEKATDNFASSRVLGEGGFGLVYSGILDDGTNVAVKVLKRDDQQAGREFLAEVEMLSRLHHRNLVKLIGLCKEDRALCLVYELISNGSVESHLHGVAKERSPLDWGSRMKIALGAARGLAYLHEDLSPGVIHRDFKSSNILLEDDFTPKVSDFGLARRALDEGNNYISTRVMGTFGYLAPEYAMTGHLLVKSDVYSYGVVLLELLTGRRPVDLSQPDGQENLVAWARPPLTNKEGLDEIIDPILRSTAPSDGFAKVAAIASMCVQPEPSHRPFMGEVVQALKLVCNEFDEADDELSIDIQRRITKVSEKEEASDISYGIIGYDSNFGPKSTTSLSGLVSASEVGIETNDSGSCISRQSSSGPLSGGKRKQFWQRLRGHRLPY